MLLLSAFAGILLFLIGSVTLIFWIRQGYPGFSVQKRIVSKGKVRYYVQHRLLPFGPWITLRNECDNILQFRSLEEAERFINEQKITIEKIL